MKAILVIDDMPNCCTACPFFEFINDYEDDCRTRCNVKFGRINEYGTDVRPKWCPLKPIPKKFNDDVYEGWMFFDKGETEYNHKNANQYKANHKNNVGNACLEEKTDESNISD